MYGIFTYIYHKHQPNAGKYTGKTYVLTATPREGKLKNVAGVRIWGIGEVDRLSCLELGP